MTENRGREDFQRAVELFHRALERPAAERRALVREAAQGDEALEEEVLGLLAAHESDATLPELPAPAPAATAGAGGAAPERVGHYHVLEKIGEGGMGSIFLAEQREPMRRRVALKLLKPGMDSRDVIARFEAERQALALMDHANIARVFDGGVTDDGRPYFAMEYVPGDPLTTYCDRERLSLRDRLELYLKICDAVQHAHQKGIIHRDLKPSNVLVTSGNGAAQPKVIDFGIAKAVGTRLTAETLFTAHGILVGTPEYMSPEQAEAGPLDIDTRSDVYSLGILLYEVLVGRLPFERASLREAGLSEVLRIRREEEPPRPSTRLDSLGDEERRTVVRERNSSEVQIRRELDRDLDWVVLRALEKDRERRYPSVSELAADIERYLRDEPVEAGPPSVTYRMGKFVRRHRLGVFGAVLLTVVLAFSAAALSLQARRLSVALDDSRRQADRAERVSNLLVDAFQEADPTRRSLDHEVTAREVLERGAEKLDDRTLPDDVRATLSTSMASAFLGLNDLERAGELADGAVETARSIGGEPFVAALIVKSQLLRTESKYAEAAEYSQDAVDHAESAALPLRTRVRALQALGGDLMGAGRYAEADVVLSDAEALATSDAGTDKVTLADLQLARARTLHQLSDYERALEYGKAAHAALEEASSNPLPVVQARRQIAITLNELGRLDEAIEWDRRSYAIAKERLGAEHPTTRTLRGNYALRLQYAGRGEEALAVSEECVAISRRVDPEGDLITYELNNLGLVQHGLERLDDAEATFREALEKQYAIVGHDHPNPGYHLMNLARVLQDAGRYEESETYYKEALELWQRLLPDDHALIGDVSVWYGALLVETGRAAEARPLIEKGVRIRAEKRGADNWRTAEARSWLGVVLAELGNFEEARTLLVDSYPMILDQRGRDWRRTRWALRRILAFHDLTGDEAGFERYAAEYREHYGALDPVDSSRRWASH